MAQIVLLNVSCISFDSYIKPQPKKLLTGSLRSCISFDSYIKPQLANPLLNSLGVVYLLIPTSNHNFAGISLMRGKLYIF